MTASEAKKMVSFQAQENAAYWAAAVEALTADRKIQTEKTMKDSIATDLLAACEWLLGQWQCYADQRYLTPEETERRDFARAAIAKAKNVEVQE